uniref:Carboxylesterase type B domain-containing protein n=1 Tax=Photinus pyralis TaxID=7054 RepID=A0A1Y1LJD1_PHOPY
MLLYFVGASHGDDTVYVLSTEVNTHSTPTDQNMSKLLVNMWTSFSSTGIPKINDVIWLQMSKKSYVDSINYLHIYNTSCLEMKSNVTLGNTPFWESLPLRENEKLMR